MVIFCALAGLSGCVNTNTAASDDEAQQPVASAQAVTNTVIAFADNAARVVSNVSFKVRSGEVQAISGGVFYARPTMEGFTKSGAGTLLVNSSVDVKGLGDVQAGTLTVANLFSDGGASIDEMIAGMPIFSALRFAPGTRLDLSDNVGFLMNDLVGAPEVVNVGILGISGKWTLTAPGEVLTVSGAGVELFGESYAGQLAFAEESTFAFRDAAAEAAFAKAAAAAGGAGVVVARAEWAYPEGATLGDVPLVMPKPAAATSGRWSMRVCDDNRTVRLFLAGGDK